MAKQKLQREVRQEALLRIEKAARTENDYAGVVDMWDKLDANRERMERYHEIGRPQTVVPVNAKGNLVIPKPVNHCSWHLMMRGDFLDFLYDCPYEMHDLVAEKYVAKLVEALSENRKEILYFLSIRQYSAERLAAVRKQTGHNIRKSYRNMVGLLRGKLADKLESRMKSGRPITTSMRWFMQWYAPERMPKQ